MGEVKRVVITILAFSLAGCTNIQPDVVPENWTRYDNTKFEYSIAFPSNATGKSSPTDAYAGFATYSALKDKPQPGDFSIRALSGEELPEPSSCSPSITGVPDLEQLSANNILWGKLDPMQASADMPYPDALCHIPIDGCTKEEMWSGTGCQHGQAGYALCSENNGKTVLICLSQMTDDPEMAEEIFKTFRWVK